MSVQPESPATTIRLLTVVRLRQDLPMGTVIEELDENTVLVEFLDEHGKTLESMPIPKMLLTPAMHSIPGPLLDVTAVEALPGFVLRLTFENGEIRRFSMSRLLAPEGTVFTQLRSVAMFRQVFIENGTVGWPGGADVDPEWLYEQSVPECSYPVDTAWENMPEVGLERWPDGEQESNGK